MADQDNVYDDEELVSTNTNRRNWRGIFIALLVIIAVLALIVTSVALLTPPDDGPRVKGNPIKLSEIISGELNPISVNASWVGDRYLCFKDVWGGISILDTSISNLEPVILMFNSTFKSINPVKFFLSPDHKYLLLAKNMKKMFRFSYLTQYVVYDISTRETIFLSLYPEKDSRPFLLFAQWTPRGHGIIINYDYDVYYKTGPFNSAIYQITTTGKPGVIHNGFPDWLYEEEILQSTQATWMSRDAQMMLYATFNDTLVEEINVMHYGDLTKNTKMKTIRYPKPDMHNPTVKFFIADIADPKHIRTKTVRPPPIILNSEHYFTSASWISATDICITWINRFQNTSVTSICNSPLWNCQEVQKIVSGIDGWVDLPYETPIFQNNGSNYVTIAPQDTVLGLSKQIVYVNIFRKQVLPLTQGHYEVSKILSWDQHNNNIFFTGIPHSSPMERHVYRVSSILPNIGVVTRAASCLTCNFNDNLESVSIDNAEDRNDEKLTWQNKKKMKNITMQNLIVDTPKLEYLKNKKFNITRQYKIDQPCKYFDAVFSPSSAYYILDCLGPGVPLSMLYKTGSQSSTYLATLQNNIALKDRLLNIALPQTKTFPVQISGGYNAQVRLYLPPGLREDEITRYPLVVQVFAAPGTQIVTDVFKIDWNMYLASKKSIIIAQIDGRGSGGQGYKLLYEIYKKLGTVEVLDQLEVTEYLRDSFHFIDRQRLAIWGWSYGGYVAGHALFEPGQNIFQCGISISPIISWKHYDSAYAERYMGSSNSSFNYHGYLRSDLRNKIENLKNKLYYIIHGTADEIVHFQQSMLLSEHLSKKGILFRQQIYADAGHNLAGVKTHLYLSLTQFLDDCFSKDKQLELDSGLRNGGYRN